MLHSHIRSRAASAQFPAVASVASIALAAAVVLLPLPLLPLLLIAMSLPRPTTLRAAVAAAVLVTVLPQLLLTPLQQDSTQSLLPKLSISCHAAGQISTTAALCSCHLCSCSSAHS
jgi:hypothetical protein